MIPEGKRIYGLIGQPVTHSLSPLMHNAAFAHQNIQAEYRLFEVSPGDLEKFLLERIQVKDSTGQSFYTTEIDGFNITIPYKVKAREILERHFPCTTDAYLVQQDFYYVQLTGAVNTVKKEDGRLRYWNTDPYGFARSLREDLRFEPKQKKVLVIGCGGAGRAVIAALSWKNAGVGKIFVYDSSDNALDSAKEHFRHFTLPKDTLVFISLKDIPDVIALCQLLVNASPVGMKEADGSVIDAAWLKKNKELCVYDAVYNRKTRLVEDARAQGLRAVGGLGMLLYQGAAAFEIWMEGQAAPPIPVMRQALEQGVQNL
jgi:shikimate dehydrogenase